MNTPTPGRPVAWAVVGSLAILVFFMGLAAAIGASYALTLNAIHNSQTAQMKGAVAECRSLEALDRAGQGITFPTVNKAHPSELALTRLFAGIHGVVVHSGCSKVLPSTKP